MKAKKKKAIESAGWKMGTASDFLGLSSEEESLITMKLSLAHSIKKCREERQITQTQLARMLGSSQSRVAKMEVADASISLELLVRAMLAMGASPKQIGSTLGKPPGRKIRTVKKKAS